MIAFREQPQLDLNPHLEVNSCWVGKKSSSSVKIVNTGGHAGFWVLPGDLKEYTKDYKPDSFETPESIQIGPYSIYPNKFYLSKGQSITLQIEFNPQDEGVYTESFVLGCDNLRVYEYTVTAESNMIELETKTINGKQLTQKCLPLQEIQFRETNYLNPETKQFEIENLTKNKIAFEWRIKDADG